MEDENSTMFSSAENVRYQRGEGIWAADTGVTNLSMDWIRLLRTSKVEGELQIRYVPHDATPPPDDRTDGRS